MVEGLHVMGRRVLQLLNQSFAWARCFQIFQKTLACVTYPVAMVQTLLGFMKLQESFLNLGNNILGIKLLS